MKPTQKFFISIAFGFIGLLVSQLSIDVMLEGVRISLHWGVIFPLLISIAYGPNYGFVAGTLGLGAFFPFLLWSGNGYNNVVAMLIYLFMYIFVGYISKARARKASWWNHYFVMGVVFSFVSGLILYLTYPLVIGLNPPPWNPGANLTMSSSVALAIATKEFANAFVAIMIAVAIGKTNTLRRILGISHKRESRFNEKALLICLFFGGVFWLFHSIILSIFVTGNFPYEIDLLSTPESAIKLLVYIVISIMSSTFVMEYLEKQLLLQDRRNEAERELLESNFVVENSPAIVFKWAHGENWPILMVSKNISQFGYSQEELTSGRVKFTDFVYSGDLEKTNSEIYSYTANNIDRYIQEYRIVTKSGDLRWVNDLTTVIRNEKGEVVGYQGVLIDVTERKKIEDELKLAKEEAEKANTVKSEFLSNMSHEIRTPLNAIVGFIGVLDDMEDDAEKSNYLRIVRESSNYLLELLDGILSLSKIEAGKIDANYEKVNLYYKMSIFSQNYELIAKRKELEFSVNLAKDLDKEILIDFHLVCQILNNLLSNAFKYTKAGEIALEARLNSSELEIRVRDTGIGINKAKQQNLYTPFEQGEHYLTKEYGGTGLGLAIVKKTVDLLGGKIEVSTELGKGTEFVVTVPFKDVDQG